MFLLPCQTLQGKHYRLNCLIPICIIRRSDNCKNRDAKGRLRAAYACCQPFAIGKAKLRTRARTSSPAGSQLPSHSLPRSPSHPRSSQTPALAGFSLPSGGVPNRTAPPRFFYPWTVWSRTFQQVLVARAAPQNPRQQNAACLGHGDLSFALHCKQMRAEHGKI